MTLAKRKARRPRVIAHRPRIINHEPVVFRFPPCSQAISTQSTIEWRTGNSRQEQKAERMGVGLYQCFMQATYQIGDRWYCKRHAALIALEMLEEDA